MRRGFRNCRNSMLYKRTVGLVEQMFEKIRKFVYVGEQMRYNIMK